jgi:hypothetical protein
MKDAKRRDRGEGVAPSLFLESKNAGETPASRQKSRILRMTTCAALLLVCSCGRNESGSAGNDPTTSASDKLPLYVCHRATKAINIDGKLDEAEWGRVAWTHELVNIEGADHEAPKFRTRCKLLWDDASLYIAAELMETDVWANFTERNSPLYRENAFEVFLDPDGDGLDYWELEINALNTVWDLRMPKPFVRGGHPDLEAHLEGLKTAVHVNGTVNQGDDVDQSWTLEIAIPFSAFKGSSKLPLPPKAGDEFRIQLARVQHEFDKSSGKYVGDASDNGTYAAWSPTGAVNLHLPEKFGHVRFEK